MIFHYVDGALMCEIKIRGLTQTLPEYNELSSRFISYYDPDDENQWWAYDHVTPYYGGYHYFVCESLTRRAAQIIVDALGGYLVPEIIPPSRQLGTGGPFHIHQFCLRSPRLVATYARLFDATAGAGMYAIKNPGERFRVYDNSGFMIGEYQLKENHGKSSKRQPRPAAQSWKL